MRTNKGSWFSDILDHKCFVTLLLVCLAVSVGFSLAVSEDSQVNARVADFAAYRKVLEARNDVKAIPIGDSIFARLEEKYKNDAGFRAYKSKLDAAEFLAKKSL